MAARIIAWLEKSDLPARRCETEHGTIGEDTNEIFVPYPSLPLGHRGHDLRHHGEGSRGYGTLAIALVAPHAAAFASPNSCTLAVADDHVDSDAGSDVGTVAHPNAPPEFYTDRSADTSTVSSPDGVAYTGSKW